MNKILVFLLSIGFVPLVNAQETDLHVVAPAGSSYQLDNMMLDWTLGEVVIASLEEPSLILSQGFHQPVYTIVSVKPISKDIGSVMVFPNPFSEELCIKMSYSKVEKGILELYDVMGKEIWKREFHGKEIVENHPTGQLISGPYLLKVTITENSSIHTYKLLKTQ